MVRPYPGKLNYSESLYKQNSVTNNNKKHDKESKIMSQSKHKSNIRNNPVQRDSKGKGH